MKMKLRSISLIVVCILVCIILSGCLSDDADYEALKETEELFSDTYSRLERNGS